MIPEVPRENCHSWSWTKFSIGIGLFPVSFVLWFVGMDAAFSPRRNLIGLTCLTAAPFVAISAAVWLVFLLVWRFTTGRRSALLITGALFLASLGLFCGIAAYFSPPRNEGEAYVFALLSGLLFLAALGCAAYQKCVS